MGSFGSGGTGSPGGGTGAPFWIGMLCWAPSGATTIASSAASAPRRPIELMAPPGVAFSGASTTAGDGPSTRRYSARAGDVVRHVLGESHEDRRGFGGITGCRGERVGVETLVDQRVPLRGDVIAYDRPVELRMKLHAPGTSAESNRGVTVERRRRDRLRPRRQFQHDVEMRRRDEESGLERQQIAVGTRFELDGANLAPERIRARTPAEGLPQQLVTEADAEHRHVALDEQAERMLNPPHPR